MSAEQREMDAETSEAIDALCEEGNVLAEAEQFEQAVAAYNQAWLLIPEPKTDWEASTWVLAAIGDCCYFLNKLTSARKALEYAANCPGGLGNAFVHMRLGEVLYEQGDHDLAADELLRAFLAGGEEAFQHEPSKYLDFLWTRAQRPASQ